MRLFVARCLACAEVQSVMQTRVNAGALCLTGAASSALTPPVRFRLALLRARGLLCVRRAEPKPLSKRRRVHPFAFRPSASVCRGADSVCSGNWEGRMSVVLSGVICSTVAASFALTTTARHRFALCRRAVGWAVLNDDAGAVRRSVAWSLGQY